MLNIKSRAGVAQLARASAFQAEDRGFEARLPLHFYANRGFHPPRYPPHSRSKWRLNSFPTVYVTCGFLNQMLLLIVGDVVGGSLLPRKKPKLYP